MYPVSAAFLQTVQENTRKYYWTGKITTKTGVMYEFGAEDIVKGSGYISNQCCGSTEIELGAVYSAEMGITLLLDIDRYTLEDALVALIYHLRISRSVDPADLDPEYEQAVEADGIYETIPMGIFEVSEANRTVKCLELKAYDFMLRFEKNFNGYETIGKAYDFIHLCCESCHVDENQISAITSMQVNLYGKQKLKGVGKNPRLAQAKSKNDKNISGLLSQIEGNKEAGRMGIHTFTNASAFSVGDMETRIISIQFATAFDNYAVFLGQIIVDVTAPEVTRTATAAGNVTIPAVNVDEIPEEGEEASVIGVTEEQIVAVSLPVSWTEPGHADVIFSFELNNQMIPIHYPQENWHPGRHTILLYYPIEDVIPNYTNIFNVYMRCEGGAATVDTGFCIASVMGQGMGAGDAWDGKIEIEEYVERFAIGTGALSGRLRSMGFSESTLWEIDELVQRSYSDIKNGRSSIGGFAVQVDVTGSNS